MPAYEYFLKGQLALYEPDCSTRFLEGVSAYHQFMSRCETERIKYDRKHPPKDE